MYQVWFTFSELPELTDAQVQVYQSFLSNLSDNIGNTVGGRVLKRALFIGSVEEVAQVEVYLQALGKSPKYCGVRDINGEWVVAKDQVEFDKHMQPVIVDGITMIPSDNTSAGWLSFND